HAGLCVERRLRRLRAFLRGHRVAGAAGAAVACRPAARRRRRDRRRTIVGRSSALRRQLRAVAGAVRARLGAAAGGDLAHHAEHRLGALPVGAAADAVPADLRARLRGPRRPRLVRAALVAVPDPAAGGGDELGPVGQPRRARHRRGGAAVLRRPVLRLHVLPRRTGARQAGASLPDPLLPDAVGRRRAGRHGGGTARPARLSGLLRAAAGPVCAGAARQRARLARAAPGGRRSAATTVRLAADRRPHAARPGAGGHCRHRLVGLAVRRLRQGRDDRHAAQLLRHAARARDRQRRAAGAPPAARRSPAPTTPGVRESASPSPPGRPPGR
ncbi:MAG: hypothetical protein H6R03_1821, partial [Burkholderiaceae bacterium]|nr:hypothetical protein [Burkholderiaceae bacterium]